jgi:hypothetical protein
MKNSRPITVLLAVVLLVGAANLGAFAATGGPLLLGKSNTATKTTKLKTTGNGAALALKTKAGKPPLKVSSTGKVKRLNADLVDGLDSEALKTKTYVYDLAVTGATQSYVTFGLPGLPPGRYIASLSISALATGAPSGVGCFVISGTGGAPDFRVPVAILGGSGDGALWFVNGGGYVDTRTAPHRVACQRSGGTAVTIPGAAGYPGTVSFTRVDSTTLAPTPGTGGDLPRQLAP